MNHVFVGLLLLVGMGLPAAEGDPGSDLVLHPLFRDEAVLQCDRPVAIWGWAAPGAAVAVELAGPTGPAKPSTANARADGRWQVSVGPFTAGGPYVLSARCGDAQVEAKDILFGDVWLAAGQSNMEIPVGVVHNSATEIPTADDPQLRYFQVSPITTLEPETGLRRPLRKGRGSWTVVTPQSVSGCSGVAYFFARDLRRAVKRPIGIIQSTFYSSAAEAWTSPEVIARNVAQDPAFQGWLDNRAARAAEFPPKLAVYERELALFPERFKTWNEVTIPAFKAEMNAWHKAAAAAKQQGQPEPAKITAEPRPEMPPFPDAGGIATVGSLFNGMIAPVIPFTIKGVIWYQGEANAGRTEQYRKLLPLMVDDWRARWGQGDFPFLLVQLASFGAVSPTPCPERDSWQWLREAQHQLAGTLKNSGIATAVDVGAPDNVHPRDKMDVGTRLALVAREKAYGEKLVSSGPSYASMRVEGTAIRISFQGVGSGLVIHAPPWTAPGIAPPEVVKLHGFAIAGEDRKWVWAQARIDGATVLVSSDQVPAPVAVRYAWSNSPEGLNFYNAELLPAFPFRTDQWTR